MVRRVRHCKACQQRFVAPDLSIVQCMTCDTKAAPARPGKSLSSDSQDPIDDSATATATTTAPPRKRARLDDHEPKGRAPTSTGENDSTGSLFQSQHFSIEEQANVPTGDILDDKGDTNAARGDGENTDDEDGGCSEGGDDLNCTQIVVDLASSSDDDDGAHNVHNEDIDDWDDAEDVPLAVMLSSSFSNQPRQSQVLASRSGASVFHQTVDDIVEDVNTGDKQLGNTTEVQLRGGTHVNSSSVHTDTKLLTCSVCGTNLRHIPAYAGRLQHIKRCSKRHGVTAQAFRYNDDHELFDDSNGRATIDPTTATTFSAVTNPYTVGSSPRKVVDVIAPAKPSATALLMAGARKVAALAKIGVKRSATEIIANGNGRSRWRFNNNNQNTWYADRPRQSQPCPAFKKIAGTDFVCDGFQYARPALSQTYFLTHFHSDHYTGITKAWNVGVIYCSQSTANLVQQQLGVDAQYLRPLPLLTPTIIESKGGRPVAVTLLDANHCPGAVMFLFQVGQRTILHVGDFRWHRPAMQKQAPLQPFISGRQRLDEIYLDTTYCDPKYALPPQDAAIAETVAYAAEQVRRAQKGNERILLLFGAYTIGKERIFLSVAEHLQCKIYVDTRRFRILTALGWPVNVQARLTTRAEDTNLWVVPLGHINMKMLPEYKSVKARGVERQFDKVIGFRPTGWSMSAKGLGIVKLNTMGGCTVCSVPYSEHSSFPELVDCLRALRPKVIKPTVSVSKSQQQIDTLLYALNKD